MYEAVTMNHEGENSESEPGGANLMKVKPLH